MSLIDLRTVFLIAIDLSKQITVSLQYCPKYFQIRKKALKIFSNLCFFIFKFLNPPVINCRKKFRVLAKGKNFLFLTAPTVSVFLTKGELKFLPPIRMNFRQFITSGRFFFCKAFLLIFQKKSGKLLVLNLQEIYFR